MFIKSANGMTKVESDTKEQANLLPTLDEMAQEAFDAKMARGFAQAKAGDGIPASQFFDSLKEELNLILKEKKT